MEEFLNLVTNLDYNLLSVIEQYGELAYLLLFLIIFCDTGLIFVPFLPSDSLLFVSGAVAALHSLDIYQLFLIFFLAAVSGDMLNYVIGNKIGRKILVRFMRLIRFDIKESMARVEVFFEKYGAKTALFGRVVPLMRVVIPFSAGFGKMNFKTFCFYDAIGSFFWTLMFLGGGYFVGMVPVVQDYFPYILVLVVCVSVASVVGALKKGVEKNI